MSECSLCQFLWLWQDPIRSWVEGLVAKHRGSGMIAVQDLKRGETQGLNVSSIDHSENSWDVEIPLVGWDPPLQDEFGQNVQQDADMRLDHADRFV